MTGDNFAVTWPMILRDKVIAEKSRCRLCVAMATVPADTYQRSLELLGITSTERGVKNAF
jgi:hypothetical protein